MKKVQKIMCPACMGTKTYLTRKEHPRGEGVEVPCSKCRGRGTVKVRVEG